jgi:predicted anti-sigma-YlaC factor YlaD
VVTCRTARLAMSDLADRELHGWRRAMVRLHLFVCPLCRRVHRDFQRTLDLPHGLQDDPPPPPSEATGPRR